jgi:hypothetical protein
VVVEVSVVFEIVVIVVVLVFVILMVEVGFGSGIGLTILETYFWILLVKFFWGIRWSYIKVPALKFLQRKRKVFINIPS